MGCHTWFHKDIEFLTEKEYKENVVDTYLNNNVPLQMYIEAEDKDAFFKERVEDMKQSIKDSLSEGFDECWNVLHYGGKNDDELYVLIKSEIEHQFQVYTYLCNHKIGKKEFYKLGLHKNYQYIFSVKKKRLYIYLEHCAKNCYFRVSSYPSFEPTSYSALMRWLGKNGKSFRYYDYDLNDYVYKVDKKFRKMAKELFRMFDNHLLINFG